MYSYTDCLVINAIMLQNMWIMILNSANIIIGPTINSQYYCWNNIISEQLRSLNCFYIFLLPTDPTIKLFKIGSPSYIYIWGYACTNLQLLVNFNFYIYFPYNVFTSF